MGQENSTANQTASGSPWHVSRKLRLTRPLSDSVARELGEVLQGISGVAAVQVEAGQSHLCVTYDASKTDYRSLGLAVEQVGLALRGGWWNQLKGRLYQFSDTNARDNAKAPPPSCCNKPPR